MLGEERYYNAASATEADRVADGPLCEGVIFLLKELFAESTMY